MEFYKILVCLAIGYLAGCFQTAYIVGRVFKKIDIRDYGSKNAGMTNTTRVLGAKYGIPVFFIDILKAILAYMICSLLFDGNGAFISGSEEIGVLPGIIAGLGVVIGHNFPVFLKFRGGKGIASTIGVILCFDWRVALIAFVLGLLLVIITRYISVASLVITGIFPILALIFGYPINITLIALIFTVFAYIRHKDNIKKLLNHTERRFNLFTKGQL